MKKITQRPISNMSDISCAIATFSFNYSRIAQPVHLFPMNSNEFKIIYARLCLTQLQSISNDRTIAQWVHHIHAMRTNGDVGHSSTRTILINFTSHTALWVPPPLIFGSLNKLVTITHFMSCLDAPCICFICYLMPY